MSPQETPPAVALAGVSKAFGATRAVSDVSFTVRAGTVHALLGENGAGKSTTMKLLSGLIEPDEGTIAIDGREVRLRSPRDAHHAGIRTAFQELTLVRDLSVLDNMLIPAAPMSFLGTLRRKQVAEDVAAHFARLGLAVDLHAEVGRLDLALRQKIEIARALYRQPRLLLLDEPTSALAGSDVEWLGALIADAKARGITVLFISHRMPEVRAFCDDMTVLRNGRRVASGAVADFTDAQVVEMIIGRSLDQTFPPRRAVPVADRPAPVLETRGLTAGAKLSDVDLVLRPGEILGVAGLQGMGQKELFSACFGALPIRRGELRVDGRPVHLSSPADALHPSLRIGFVPEDRKTEGLFLNLDGTTNASLPVIDSFCRHGLIDRASERAATDRVFAAVDVAAVAAFKAAGAFSGGNQQKIAVAKWLVAQSRILLLFDPTRGIDVGTKHQLYELIRAFADAGGAVLFHSTEIPELVHLSDRAIVLYEGRVTARLELDALDERTVMRAVLGHGATRLTDGAAA
ncbi:sugar ABC transporter ATP-binding protein [Ancylobacter polymorphus]|uniref:Ribose transport system ATP-binding protein n=1 Tax=Ancylobacter polymorphus TaxID=223390 RepID=A0ABU0B9S8_9HYPH|nr:sugar ABC transporter ATP-binding protein [Ancylobacter polymorphus]MDQ0302586.1 ribose transport system ATP-binding protein [Ancylobacter polymorphus]